MDTVRIVVIVGIVGCFAIQAGVFYVACMSIRKITDKMLEVLEESKEIE